MVELVQVTDRIEAEFPRLSPQLKRAARYVLDSPDDVALSSMRALATRADVHPSALVRLAKELGFKGYVELREPFRETLRRRPERYAERARNLQARGGGELDDLYRELIDAGSDNIAGTFAECSPERLANLAVTMEAARHIYVVGMRKCLPVAFYIHYACRMFHQGVTLLGGFAGTMADELRDLGADDVFLAISFDPYTRETVRAARHAVAMGATVVAITDSPLSPLAEGAVETLVVANAGPSFFRSLVAAMALAEALVAFLVARGGDRAIETLTQTEAKLDDFDIYLQRPERRTGRQRSR